MQIIIAHTTDQMVEVVAGLAAQGVAYVATPKGDGWQIEITGY